MARDFSQSVSPNVRLGRLVQTEISDPLAEEILFGRLRDGGQVRIGFRSGKFTFSFC